MTASALAGWCSALWLLGSARCATAPGCDLKALASQLSGRNIAEISAFGLGELRGFMADVPNGLPAELSRLTSGLLAELDGLLTPLLDVGLSYLTVDRASASLSTLLRVGGQDLPGFGV